MFSDMFSDKKSHIIRSGFPRACVPEDHIAHEVARNAKVGDWRTMEIPWKYHGNTMEIPWKYLEIGMPSGKLTSLT